MPATPTPDYPAERDAEWIAVDRAGRVAVFTTGGAGPMPVAYWTDADTLDALTAAIYALPVVTTAIPAPWTEHAGPAEPLREPLPESWAAFAERGCFVYDWSDVHRTRDRLGRYELMARPEVPRPFGAADWPPVLRPLLEAMRSEQLEFGARTVDVTRMAVELGAAPRE